MSSSAEESRRATAAARLLRLVALVAFLALAWLGPAAAQDAVAMAPPQWRVILDEAAKTTGSRGAATEDLENLRDRLLALRSEALDFEAAAAARLNEVRARLEALGPAPAEGATEPAALAQRRTQIDAEIAAAQAPVLEAQDVRQGADGLIREIDRIVRARFAAELRSRGPSPLRPDYWLRTMGAVAENLGEIRGTIGAALQDEARRTAILNRIPIDLALALVGIALTFAIRRRLGPWVEAQLEQATRARHVALLVNLRNFASLIVPAVAVGLLFAALDPETLLDPRAEKAVFELPDFAIAIIAANWLGNALFAPKLAIHRLAPLERPEAAAGARLSLALGLLTAAHFLIRRYTADWTLTAAEAATLTFPLFLVGGPLLWRASRLLRGIRRRILERDGGAPAGERTGAIVLSVLSVAERGAWAIAIAAPLLAAAGFLAAASFLLFAAILTLGLFGAGVAVYDLITVTFGAMGRPAAAPGADTSHEGLAPVIVAAALSLAALPALALIWGARPSDIAGVYYALRDGVTLGGIRISIGMVASFTLVFFMVFGLSRVLQSLLRNNVLPRTRMDAGGRNAILAGVGYAGFFIAIIAAVSSTGIDLTSLAVVAGALSVGIGFGLQNIVSNFVSGIILLVERPIKEGDWIEVGGQMGFVRDISVRSTVIETFDKASLILPNSSLIAGAVLNRTHKGMTGRLTVNVTVGCGADPKRVERILTRMAEEHPMVLLDPAPRVLFTEFGLDSLKFELRCWLRDVNYSLSAKSDLNFAIFERLAAESVAIPFPQRDLHAGSAGALRPALDPEDEEKKAKARGAAEKT